jgi:hypothetical protein
MRQGVNYFHLVGVFLPDEANNQTINCHLLAAVKYRQVSEIYEI